MEQRAETERFNILAYCLEFVGCRLVRLVRFTLVRLVRLSGLSGVCWFRFFDLP